MLGKKYKVLVNRENKIPNNYIKNIKLVKAIDIEGEVSRIEKRTYMNFLKLQNYLLKEEKINVGLDGTYRDATTQMNIYNKFVKRYGKTYADNIVAPVNHSEHQTGLAIDLTFYVDKKGYITDNNELFALRNIFEEKIHKHLYKFGFILRYPENREKITGYSYEPWHIRYVGKSLAKKIYNNNLTLEEYYMKKSKQY